MHLKARIPSICAGSAAIFLAAHGRLTVALSVVGIGLLAEVASALALAVQGAGEGLRAGLRERLREKASGAERARERDES